MIAECDCKVHLFSLLPGEEFRIATGERFRVVVGAGELVEGKPPLAFERSPGGSRVPGRFLGLRNGSYFVETIPAGSPSASKSKGGGA